MNSGAAPQKGLIFLLIWYMIAFITRNVLSY